MHLLQRMKVWKELRRLEQRARETPSPSTFVDLGQVYINLDLHDKAERVADDGLALFPKSTELRQLLECARRGLRHKRMHELRTRLTRSPDAKLFAELARLQLEVNDLAALSQTCAEWSLRFPDDAGSWLVLGQAKLMSFYRDLAAREGQEAVRCLERAVQMDPDAAEARRSLGEVLYRIGAVQAAQQQFEIARTLQPDDAELVALLQHVQGLADQGEEVDDLFADVEVHGSLRHPSFAAAPLPHGDESMARIRDGLAHVAQLPGVKKATFIRGSKALVKGAIRDGRDPFLRIVRVVAKAAHRFARRLDIGSANKSVVDGAFGRICICVYGEALAAAQCDARADLPRVLGELQEIVAGALHAGDRS
ncbi:MAG: tetratricopeptide repeat protein [Planctomycetes bacterium]|nr:tetratricopeptide repeat protein [Planctomycetota bacterium]MCC7396713.1 hypothetical protein [Planctomycetota bacterium]